MVKEGIDENYDEINLETSNEEENCKLHIFYKTIIDIAERIIDK